MKILFLNPPFLPKYSRQSRSPCVTKGGTVYYPYYLVYAAGVAEQAGFEVRLADGVTNSWSHEDAVKFARDTNPELVVLDTSTPSIKNDIEVAAKIRAALPATHINLVGTFPTNMTEECFRMSHAIDSACRGEYDYTIRSLAQHLQEGKDLHTVNGLSFRENGNIINNGPADLVENLDSLPFASELYLRHFREAGIKNYFYASITWPEIQILTARGCKYGCSFCLTSNMPIITDKGMHTIGELVEQFKPDENDIVEIDNDKFLKVLSHDGEFHPVDAVMKREFKGELNVLKVQGIPFSMELTPNHKIYASKDGGEPLLIRADKLEGGDYVAIPRIRRTRDITKIDLAKVLKPPTSRYKKVSKLKESDIEKVKSLLKNGYSKSKVAKLCNISRGAVSKIAKGYQRTTYHDYKLLVGDTLRYSNSKKSVPRTIMLESGLLRLFGYYLAEGHVSKSTSRPNSKVLVFTFNKKEVAYLEDIKNLVKKYFGLKCTVSDSITAYQITIYSTIVASLFERLFGTGAPEKRIPWEWIYLPMQKQISLFKGYFRGDGFKIPKRIGFNTTSRILTEQFQLILNRLGIYSSLQITKKGKYQSNIEGRTFTGKHDRYDVWVFGKAKERLNAILGNMFVLDNKKVTKPERWKKTDRYILVPITNLSKKQYDGYVYNFSVKDSHSYTVHGVALSNCNIPMKKSYRTRSVKNAVDEFEFINQNMPFLSEIMLEDDTFPMEKQRTIEFCEEIVRRGLKLTWSCNARVNTDLETMQKMKEAGCRLMCVGFESPTQASLNSVVKGQTGGMEKTFMDSVRKTGLLVNGCFILGLPTDTPETMQATIDFAKDLNPNSAQFYPLMVYPGTGAYEWAKKNGFLETEDWSRWTTEEGLHNTTVSRPSLTSEELLHWCNKARLEFYTNPKFLTKMTKQALTSRREAVRIMKGSKVLFKHLINYAFSEDAKVRKNRESEAESKEQTIPILHD